MPDSGDAATLSLDTKNIITEQEQRALAETQAARADAEAAASRFAFLAEASQALSSSLDYEQTLRDLARLAVPTLGGVCIVDVLEDGQLRRVAASHVNASKADLLEQLRLRYPVTPDSPQPAGRVLRSGRPELLEEVDAAVVASHVRDEEHAAMASCCRAASASGAGIGHKVFTAGVGG